MITGLWEPWRLYLCRTAIATPDHGAVATYIITQLIGVPAWWHCRWQLYLTCMAWYLIQMCHLDFNEGGIVVKGMKLL
jgi:hypothetical protein